MEYLVRPLWVDIMLFLSKEEEVCFSEVAKKVDSTYSHIVKVLNVMEQKDLIETYKTDRRRLIKMTKSGRQLAEIAKGIGARKDVFKRTGKVS